jgi:hypothetical protein
VVLASERVQPALLIIQLFISDHDRIEERLIKMKNVRQLLFTGSAKKCDAINLVFRSRKLSCIYHNSVPCYLVSDVGDILCIAIVPQTLTDSPLCRDSFRWIVGTETGYELELNFNFTICAMHYSHQVVIRYSQVTKHGQARG